MFCFVQFTAIVISGLTIEHGEIIRERSGTL